MLAYSDYLLRVVLALGLGASIGVECQWWQRLVGLRTITLVLLGSASFIALVLRFALSPNPSPLRVAAQIISSIGFLGAITMKEGLYRAGPEHGRHAVVLGGRGVVVRHGLRGLGINQRGRCGTHALSAAAAG